MRVFAYIALLFSTFLVNAQDVELKAYINRDVITENDYVQYTLEANARGDFELPDMEDFDLVRTGGTSSSSSIKIINGEVSKSVSYSQSFVLKPLKKGVLTIPPAKITVDGVSHTSNSIKIEVVEGTKNVTSANSDYFARIQLNKTTAYVGEPILASYYMYTKNRPSDAAVNMKTSNQNFWTEELSNKLELSTDIINGQNYYVVNCKKVVLFPQKSGKLNVDAFDGQMQILKQKRSGFFSVPDYERVDVRSNSPTVNILPLPTTAKPTNFVGDYTIYMEASKTETNVNEGFDLKVTIEGTGNLNRINEFDLNLPSDFEVYDPEIKENINLTSKGYKGKKTFNYLIIPRAAGTFEIDGINLNYFNPSVKSYKTKATPAFTIKVNKGDITSGTPQVTQSNKKEVELLDNDIRYLKPQSKWLSFDYHPLKTWWFWLSATLPLLVLAYIFFMMPILQNRVKSISLEKQAYELLQKAEEDIKQAKEEVFTGHLLNAWQLFLEHHLGLKKSLFNKQNLNKKLHQHKDRDTILSIIDQLEMAKYAPVKPAVKAEMIEESKRIFKTFTV